MNQNRFFLWRVLNIRTRVRLITAFAFLIAGPICLIAVYRTQAVSDYANSAKRYDLFSETITQLRLKTQETYVGVWRYLTTLDVEYLNKLEEDFKSILKSLQDISKNEPEELQLSLETTLWPLAQQIELGLEKIQLQKNQLNHANKQPVFLEIRTVLFDLSEGLKDLDNFFKQKALFKHEQALEFLSKSGRDQLVLFLILLFMGFIMILGAPLFVLKPLYRLKKVDQLIELGRIKEIETQGDGDEIDQISGSIKHAILKKENIELKKSAKIFEVRNVLRAVISNIQDAVLVIDTKYKITFVNLPAADLLKEDTHYLEGTLLSEHVNFRLSSELKAYLEKAQEGDLEEGFRPINVKLLEGSELKANCKLAIVREREGNISRIVIVFSSHASH